MAKGWTCRMPKSRSYFSVCSKGLVAQEVSGIAGDKEETDTHREMVVTDAAVILFPYLSS